MREGRSGWQMDTRIFEYMLALERHRNFTAAARELQVSPQGLNNAIHRLENELGVELVSTMRGSVELTEYGRLFVTHAKSIVDELDATHRGIAALLAHRHNIVRLGCAVGILGYLGENAIEQFNEQNDDCQVLVSDELPDAECARRLMLGDYDFALLTAPPLEGCVSVQLVQDYHFLWVNLRDPLSRKEQIRLDDLNGRAVASMNDDYHYVSTFIDVCAQAGVHPNLIFTGEMIRVYELARAGKALGLTCRNHAEATAESSKTVALPFKALPWGFSICWRRDHATSESEARFLDYMRSLKLVYS